VGETGFSAGKHLHFDLVFTPFDVDDAPYYGRVDPNPYFTTGTTYNLASGQSGSTTNQEDELSAADAQHVISSLEGVMNHVFDRIKQELPGDTARAVLSLPVQYKDPVTGQDRPGETTTLETVAGFADFNAVQTRALVQQGPPSIAAQIDAAGLAEAVRDELVKLLGGK